MKISTKLSLVSSFDADKTCRNALDRGAGDKE
jgi:hypothetical protein